MPAGILVIDDDVAFLEMLGEALTDAGYAVALYTSPPAALADLAHIQPDLVLSVRWVRVF